MKKYNKIELLFSKKKRAEKRKQDLAEKLKKERKKKVLTRSNMLGEKIINNIELTIARNNFCMLSRIKPEELKKQENAFAKELGSIYLRNKMKGIEMVATDWKKYKTLYVKQMLDKIIFELPEKKRNDKKFLELLEAKCSEYMQKKMDITIIESKKAFDKI